MQVKKSKRGPDKWIKQAVGARKGGGGASGVSGGGGGQLRLAPVRRK